MRLSSLLLSTILTSTALSYKILVYSPKFGYSHSNFLGNIADILVEEGHEVTSFIPIIDPEVKDGTSKSKRVYVEQSLEIVELLRSVKEQKADFFSANVFDPLKTLFNSKIFDTQYFFQCKAVLDDTETLEYFKAEQIDVMIVENFDMCGVAYSHLIKPKALITSSASTPFSFMFEEFGIPMALSYNPSSYLSTLDAHSMFDRAKNVYAEALMHILFWPGRWMIEELYRERFGADFPSSQEISSHAAYTLVNSEPLIDFAAPTLSRVIAIGGIGAKEPQPLNEYWSEILSRRPHTVLLSFGSVAKSIFLPDAIKNSLLTTFANFPDVTFIWKYEQPDDDFGRNATTSHTNLVLCSWMLQSDLLADDRISAFITHGGMGSTQETAIHGKPGIFIPIFGDQSRNAGMLLHNGFGKVVDKFDLTKPEVLIAAVREVLSNESYRKNAQKISAMLARKPFSARELLIRTVEFAAEFGPSKALRPQSYDMSWVEYHNLDIIAVFLAICIFSIFFTFTFLRFLHNTCSKYFQIRIYIGDEKLKKH